MDIKQNQDERPIRYTLRLAIQDDLPHIVNYFKDPSRPWTVFERTKEAFSAAIDNELMWLLTDPAGNINTTAAVHILPGGMTIGSTVATSSADPHPMSLAVNFAEIGSIWKQENAPAGFCLELVYSACILQTYLKAHELLISALVTQVVANNNRGIQKLLRLKQGWESFILNPECTHQFQKTIPDPSCRATELVSYYTPVGVSILRAARCLLGLDKSPKFSSVPRLPGVLQAHDWESDKTVEVDLSATRLIATAQKIVELTRSQNLRDIIGNSSVPWFAAEKQLLNERPLSPRRRRVTTHRSGTSGQLRGASSSGACIQSPSVL